MEGKNCTTWPKAIKGTLISLAIMLWGILNSVISARCIRRKVSGNCFVLLEQRLKGDELTRLPGPAVGRLPPAGRLSGHLYTYPPAPPVLHLGGDSALQQVLISENNKKKFIMEEGEKERIRAISDGASVLQALAKSLGDLLKKKKKKEEPNNEEVVVQQASRLAAVTHLIISACCCEETPSTPSTLVNAGSAVLNAAPGPQVRSETIRLTFHLLLLVLALPPSPLHPSG